MASSPPPVPSTAPHPPRRALAALLAVSLGLTALVPVTNVGPYGDLSQAYTDHLHHAYATWVFWKKGLDAYRLPLGESSRGVSYPQASPAWPEMPVNYPPGMFAVFLPLALLGRFVPMSHETFGRVGILWLVLLAHLALAAVFLLLVDLPPGGRAAVGVLAWIYLVRLALQGFYDVTFIGAGALALRDLGRGRSRGALLWLAAAGLLHYRAVVLVPAGLAAAWRAVRGRPVREWPWPTFLAVAGAGAVTVATFLLMWPASERYLSTLSPSLAATASGPRFWAVVLSSTGVAVACVLWSDWLVGGLVLAAMGLALTDIYDWWHGAVLLFAPLAVGVLRGRSASSARAALLGWILLMQPLGFADTPSDLFRDFAAHYRPRP